MVGNLQKAIEAIKAGDKVTGQLLLAQIIQDDPYNEAAFLWMAASSDDVERKRDYLKKALAINPDSLTAKKGLAQLGPEVELPDFGPVSTSTPTASSPSPEPASVVVPSQPGQKAQGGKQPIPLTSKGRSFGHFVLILVIGFVVVGVLSAVVQAIHSATPAGKATNTAVAAVTATAEAMPTEIPKPTKTVRPTKTPRLTKTITSTPGPTGTPTNTPEPTHTVEPEAALLVAIRDVLGDGNRDVPRISALEVDDNGIIFVMFAAQDGFTQKNMAHSVEIDLADILEAVANSGYDYQRVDAIATFSMVDAFGNAEEDIVVNTMFSRDTIDRINWDNFLNQDVYLVADEVYYLHPEFAPQD